MNEIMVNAINKGIGYEKGQIYFEEGKNWTSELWKECSRNGWRMSSNKGINKIHDDSGKEVVFAIGRVNALRDLAKLLR